MKHIIFLLLVIPFTANAERDLLYKCQLVSYSKAGITKPASETIDVYIINDKTAVMELGVFGTKQKFNYSVLNLNKTISLAHISPSESLDIITIDNKLNIVFSKHSMFINDELQASQYYGKCKTEYVLK